MSRSLSHRGMTLIEIMMATFVIGILGALTLGIMWTSVDAQEDTLTMHERYHAGRVAIERMKKELTMAFVSLHQAEDARTQTLFEGEQHEIVFNTSAYEPLARDARQSDQLEVRYAVQRTRDAQGDDVDALVRRAKFHIDDRPGEGGREEVLVEGVKSLEFEYFDPFREDWRGDWEVRVDNALDMRFRLKEVQAIRDKLDDVAEDEATGVAGVVAAGAAEQAVSDAELELLDGMFLPSRVRIRLVLENHEGLEFPTETQVEIPLTEPLWY